MEKKKNNKIISAARVYGIYYLLLQKSESDMDILISALSTNNKVVYKEVMSKYCQSDIDIEYLYKNKKFELRKLKKIHSLLQAIINQDLTLYDPKWNNRK